MLLCLAVPAVHADNCGKPKRARPHRSALPGRPPLIVGDSVLLGAVPEVAGAGYEVDTRGCRQMSEGLRLLASRRARLPSFVVVMLGANGEMAPGQIRRALRILGRGRMLGLMTPRRNPQARRRMHAAARRYPGRVVLLDWAAFTARHSGWFAPDGNHLGPGGAQALARFVRRALRFAIPLDGRWELRRRSAPRDAFSASDG
jgi:hypothetical protein